MDNESISKAREIVLKWGLTRKQTEDLLADNTSNVLSIHEALVTIFQDEERALAWPQKPNNEFECRSALDVILDGDIERVQQYLKYHVYNA